MLTLSMQDFCRIRGLSLFLLFQPRFLSHMYFIFPFCLRPIMGCLPRDPRVWAYLYSIINFVRFLIVIHFGIKQDFLPSWRVPSSTNSYLYLILTFYFEQDSMVSPSETITLQGHLEIKKYQPHSSLTFHSYWLDPLLSATCQKRYVGWIELISLTSL